MVRENGISSGTSIKSIRKQCGWKNQRDIIVKRYLEDEDVCDYMVYNEIGMSERTYRRVKARAFINWPLLLD